MTLTTLLLIGILTLVFIVLIAMIKYNKNGGVVGLITRRITNNYIVITRYMDWEIVLTKKEALVNAALIQLNVYINNKQITYDDISFIADEVIDLYESQHNEAFILSDFVERIVALVFTVDNNYDIFIAEELAKNQRDFISQTIENLLNKGKQSAYATKSTAYHWRSGKYWLDFTERELSQDANNL